MKHENHSGFGRSASVVKAALSGIALAGLLGFAMNAQAQTCTTANWSGATNLGDANTGTQGASNRRYGGPCGLRVSLDGTARFVSDDSPTAESSYIARFYAFFSGVNAQTVLFAADDGTDDQIEVHYNVPNAGDLTLRVFDQGAGANDLTFNGVGAGWHSIELVWESAASAEIRFALDSEDSGDDLTATINTSGITLENAHLGNLDAVNGGSIDFDDFDSRRISRPGRLLVGDADDNGSVSIFDTIAILGEFQSAVFASGQPDCNENGSVDIFDAICTIGIFQ